MLSEQNVIELMQVAIKQAEISIQEGDSPFGAVIADSEGNVFAVGRNRENTDKCVVSHAETNTIAAACQKAGAKKLPGYVLVCTGEPCSMCASAIIKCGITEVYYGAAMEPSCNPYITFDTVAKAAKQPIYAVSGVCEDQCLQLLKGR